MEATYALNGSQVVLNTCNQVC